MSRARRMTEGDVLNVRASLVSVAIQARGHACAARPGSVEREVTVERFERERDTLHRFERHSMLTPTRIEAVE